jgi:hypothetical protein
MAAGTDDPFDIEGQIWRNLARSMRDRQEYEAWKILKDAMPPMDDSPVLIDDDAAAIAETAKALLVGVGPVQFWVPKSALHVSNAVNHKLDTGKLVLKYWFARKEKLL